MDSSAARKFEALVRGAHAELMEIFESVPEGKELIFPPEKCWAFCRSYLYTASNIEDAAVTAAFLAKQTAQDDATREAAGRHFDEQIERVIVEHDLEPIVNALFDELFTRDPDEAR